MPDYRKMYAIMCSAASNALDALRNIPQNALVRKILQDALNEAEELYIRQIEKEGSQ